MTRPEPAAPAAPLSGGAEPQRRTELDALLEAYLQALDRYTKLRERMGLDFANGFMSLAEANSRRPASQARFGQGCYDGRMKAARTVDVSRDHGAFKLAAAGPTAAGDGPAPADPLRQFGILVPPALRAAQRSFAAAAEGPVLQLVQAAKELEGLERQIERARRAA